MTKKINAKLVIKNLNGTPVKGAGGVEATVGYIISEILLLARMGGKRKMYALSELFYEKEQVELDDVDFALVKSAVDADENYSNLVTGFILKELDKLDKEAEVVTPEKK